MNRIVIEAVSQNAMRPPYNQEADGAGDWLFDADGNLIIRVIGETLAAPETFLFAFHELAEAYLCQYRGIPQAEVDAFDRAFNGDGEPGDDPCAPYKSEHRFAMLIEHLMARELGLDDYGTVS